MAFNSLESSLLDAQRENYIGVLKGSIPVADNGWSTYLNTPVGTSPSSGIGGIASSILSLDIISPMSGDSDLRFAKDGSNRQGEGFGYSFSINRSHLGRVLQISFDAELISANNTYENPIIVPIQATYIISSTTCTVTANHSFIQGQVVNMTFTGATPPPNGFYTITSVTATSFVFTIPSGSAATQIACSYTAIGDLRVFIIQDPMGTPVVIEPVNVNIQLGTQNQRIRHIATFQTHISITSYRLCIHVGTGSTVAYTVDFANFRVWEPTQSIGAVITDWQSYIPTLSGFVTSSQDFQWRRVGSDLQIQGRWVTSSGSGVEFRVPLPNGLVIDSTKIPSLRVVGVMGYSGFGSTYFGSYATAEPSVSYITGSYQTSGVSNLAKRNGSDWINGVATFSIEATVPIAGWGSNVAMSSDTGDGRVVSAIYKNLVGSLNTQYGFQWNSRVIDTHNAVSQVGTSPNARTVFTAPVNGFYQVSAFVLCNNSGYVDIYKNDSIYARISGIENTVYGDSISFTISLNAGESFYIRTMNMTSTSTSTSDGQFSVFRISSGSQIIATQETVACSYWLTGNTASNTDAIPFGGATGAVGRIYDTHGSMINGTFTAPVNGIYLVTSYINTNQTSSWVEVWINGSQNRRRFPVDSSGIVINSYIQLRLLAGQTLQLRPFTSFVVFGGTLDSGGTSQIEISRITL